MEAMAKLVGVLMEPYGKVEDVNHMANASPTLTRCLCLLAGNPLCSGMAGISDLM